MNRLVRAAYRRPKRTPKAGWLIDTGSTVGTKIVQTLYLKSTVAGYKAGRGKR